MFRAPVKRNDSPFLSWQREMNNMLDRFSRDLDISGTDFEDYFPKVEIREKDNSYLISAEVPGMSEKDISVTLKDNKLILEGERKSESKKEEKGNYMSEFHYGSFYRSIPLNDEVDPDKVKAAYKDGILTVSIEKLSTGKKKSTSIPILKQ